MGVTLTPCPKAVVASSTFPTLSKGNIIPVDSPLKSIPVLLPKPNRSRYENNFSYPNICPNFTKPGLQEFSSTCKKVCSPWPPAFQHPIRAPPM